MSPALNDLATVDEHVIDEARVARERGGFLRWCSSKVEREGV
jgi:hypothetical protein